MLLRTWGRAADGAAAVSDRDDPPPRGMRAGRSSALMREIVGLTVMRDQLAYLVAFALSEHCSDHPEHWRVPRTARRFTIADLGAPPDAAEADRERDSGTRKALMP